MNSLYIRHAELVSASLYRSNSIPLHTRKNYPLAFLTSVYYYKPLSLTLSPKGRENISCAAHRNDFTSYRLNVLSTSNNIYYATYQFVLVKVCFACLSYILSLYQAPLNFLSASYIYCISCDIKYIALTKVPFALYCFDI